MAKYHECRGSEVHMRRVDTCHEGRQEVGQLDLGHLCWLVQCPYNCCAIKRKQCCKAIAFITIHLHKNWLFQFCILYLYIEKYGGEGYYRTQSAVVNKVYPYIQKQNYHSQYWYYCTIILSLCWASSQSDESSENLNNWGTDEGCHFWLLSVDSLFWAFFKHSNRVWVKKKLVKNLNLSTCTPLKYRNKSDNSKFQQIYFF